MDINFPEMTLTPDQIILRSQLLSKIKVLHETTWERRVPEQKLDLWLNNFRNENERLHALFLLSQFMYYGSFQIRELLKALYRDLYRYPIIEEIRLANSGTLDTAIILAKFKEVEAQTRYIGFGNPSESGTHLLYFFRQENRLSKQLFISSDEIFRKKSPTRTVFSGLYSSKSHTVKLRLSQPKIKEYVFIDDFCGSGEQALNYSHRTVAYIKKLNPSARVSFLTLFSTKSAKDRIRSKSQFDRVESVMELDESFRCFHSASRYFKKVNTNLISKAIAQDICERSGEALMRNLYQAEGLTGSKLASYVQRDKLGFCDGQLLIGFHHNTPDNTLPIIWHDEEGINWNPVFRRYNKKYGT